jgi:hypothetical protein
VRQFAAAFNFITGDSHTDQGASKPRSLQGLRLR